jgi:hypothetical protein
MPKRTLTPWARAVKQYGKGIPKKGTAGHAELKRIYAKLKK